MKFYVSLLVLLVGFSAHAKPSFSLRRLLVSPRGDVAVEVKPDEYMIPDKQPENVLHGKLIDGLNSERFVVEDEVLYYIKDGKRFYVAYAEGGTQYGKTDYVWDTELQKVFQIDPDATAKVIYDDIKDEWFMWAIDNKDTPEHLPYLEVWYSHYSEDPGYDGYPLFYTDAEKKDIRRQLQVAKSRPYTLENLPEGPLFKTDRTDEHVCALESKVYLPLQPLDRNVLIGFSHQHDGYIYRTNEHLEWLVKNGYVATHKFYFKSSKESCI